MATFAKSSFDATAYLARRPSYPAYVAEAIIAYAAPSSLAAPRTAVDLGCGPGQLTTLLAETGTFDRVVGLDPSPGMVGTAENLSSFGENQVALVTSAQAAHWFDHPTVYREIGRILQPGGTVAHVGYGEFYLQDHPDATDVIRRYMRGKLGPYWEDGRKHVNAEYDTIPHPVAEARFDPATFKRVKYNLDTSTAYRPLSTVPDLKVDERHPPAIVRRWTTSDVLGYLRTASATHDFEHAHPGSKPAETLVDELKAVVGGRWQQDDPDAKETVVWPLTIILAQKAR